METEKKKKRTFKEWQSYELEHAQKIEEPMTYEEYKLNQIKGKAAKMVDSGLRKIGSTVINTTKNAIAKKQREIEEEKKRNKGKKQGNGGAETLKNMQGF